MPYVNISTSKNVDNKIKILDEISTLIASLTNKPKRFVMAKLEDNSEMYFDDDSPCCFLKLQSIGSLNPSIMSMPISNFIHENMGIPIDRIYISFEDMPASMWAWNGKPFG